MEAPVKKHTDTEMLDWLLANIIEGQSDEGAFRLAAAIMLGKKGREIVATAMDAMGE